MERVPVKVTITSSPRKRAKTWEISDSEDDEIDRDVKGAVSESTPLSDNTEDSPFARTGAKHPLGVKHIDETAGGHDQSRLRGKGVDEAAGGHDQSRLTGKGVEEAAGGHDWTRLTGKGVEEAAGGHDRTRLTGNQADEAAREHDQTALTGNQVDVAAGEHDQTGLDIPATTAEPTGLKKESGDLNHPPSTSTLSLPPPKSLTPSPVKRTRKKKSPEEVEADQAQAKEKKREKELKRQEKERIKNLEKEEREKRKESAQALKLLRPDQCGKYMIVQVDAALLQDARSEDMLEALGSAGYNYSIEPHSIPWSVTWRREMPADWTCVEGLELCKGEEDQLLIVVDPRDFLKSVSCYVQVPESSATGETPASVLGIDKKCSGKRITLAVLGLPDYRRYQRLSHKMERHSKAKQHCYDELTESRVTGQHIDEALVFLQLYHETEVLFLDTWRELGQHVCAVTKSIAQRPFRLHWDAQSYSFCTTAGTWRGWGPKGSLTGLPLAWRRQIQQLNRVSPTMAAVITEAYPSPQLLMQAYAACNTDKERLSLLSNLKVPRAAGTVEDVDDPDEDATRPNDQTRERRIGPDLSRRICLFMTSTNPELVLDLNS